MRRKAGAAAARTRSAGDSGGGGPRDAHQRSNGRSVDPNMITQMKMLILDTSGTLPNAINIYQPQWSQEKEIGFANALVFVVGHNNDTEKTINFALCSIDASFKMEGDLQIIMAHDHWLGNLVNVGSHIVKEKRLPGVWTNQDSKNLHEYFNWICQSKIGVEQFNQPKYSPLNLG